MQGGKGDGVGFAVVGGVDYVCYVWCAGEDFGERWEETGFGDEDAGGSRVEGVCEGGGAEGVVCGDDGEGLRVRGKGGLEPFCAVVVGHRISIFDV